MSHRYPVGQPVLFVPGDEDIMNTSTDCGTVIRLLPKDGTDYEYHVQFGAEGERRRVRESQLRSFRKPVNRLGPLPAMS